MMEDPLYAARHSILLASTSSYSSSSSQQTSSRRKKTSTHLILIVFYSFLLSLPQSSFAIKFSSPLTAKDSTFLKEKNAKFTPTAAIMTSTENKGGTKAPPKPDSALKSFLSGGVGGACAVIVGHPFDLVKVRIQTGGSANASVFGMLRKTFAMDGISGIYRGVSAPLVATSPMYAVSFWGYDIGKRIVKSMDKTHDASSDESYKFTTSQLCVAGGISALPTTLIMAPSERLKCLLQVQANEVEKGGKAKYNGLVDCAVKVYKEGGIRSVFKGTGATLLRDVPGSIAWFGTYEVVKKQLMKIQNIDPESGKLSPMAVLTAGGIAGLACWIVSIPADVLKSRYQTAPPGQYSGLIDVYQHLMKEEGPGALFRGIRPALIRAFPANAACFLGMEVSRKLFAFMD